MDRSILDLPNGARFHKCALQVNPFTYVQAQAKGSSFEDELAYNAAIVKALVENAVDVIAVADHHSIKSSLTLIEAATAAGIHVFNGFELESKDGIHFVALFDREKPVDTIDRILGQCGIYGDEQRNKPCMYDSQELLEKITELDGLCIAAHIFMKKGLLYGQGTTRANIWKDSNLHCVAIECGRSDVDQKFVDILRNVDPSYVRERPMAIINCNDIWNPFQIADSFSTTFIKMSTVSVEGLRQAFVDPESRVRLNSDDVPALRMEIVGIEWSGGFLDEAQIHFNDALNVLVGGRGSGKSTVIESIRQALAIPAIGADAKLVNSDIQKYVLRNGTKITLSVRTHKPAPKNFTIERIIPHPPVVKDDRGKVLAISPSDIMPGVQVFGQHEIGEVAKSPTYLMALLDRFSKVSDDLIERRRVALENLASNRVAIAALEINKKKTAARLEALPAMQLKLARFEELGVVSKLQVQKRLVQEQSMILLAKKKLGPINDIKSSLRKAIPIEAAFADEKARSSIGADPSLSQIERAFIALSHDLEVIVQRMDQAIDGAATSLQSTLASWQARNDSERESYARVLQELQVDSVDGSEYVELQRRIDELKPLADGATGISADLLTLWEDRKALLAEWDQIQQEEFRVYDLAARELTSSLNGRLRVEVSFHGDPSPFKVFMDRLDGRVDKLKALTEAAGFSLRAVGQAVIDGRAAIEASYPDLPAAQVEKLSQADLEFRLELQEIALLHTTNIQLNVASSSQSPPQWKKLQALSTGQKATAVLLLLLIGSDAPLVIDQPEDDLDNAFISDTIVRELRQSKRRRQFIFATHNANIPVLGDAELIAGLVPDGEAATGRAQIPGTTVGSIDTKSVRDLVGQVLEGGREAFDTRRIKYGY